MCGKQKEMSFLWLGRIFKGHCQQKITRIWQFKVVKMPVTRIKGELIIEPSCAGLKRSELSCG